jgi:hypothetical protein
MTAGLFDRSPESPEKRDPDEGSADPADRYRAVGGVTIAALVLAVLSPLAFFDWWLAVVPLLACVLAVVGLRDIAARPTELTGRPLTLGALAFAGLMLVAGLAYQARVYSAELPEGFERIDYSMLQPLDGDPEGTMPPSALALDGKDVLLKGYMYPGKQQRGIVQFLLVRDQGDCCFGGNPKITDRVLVQIVAPRGIDFSPRLRKIAGRFAVRPTGTAVLEGGVLYHLENAVER